MLDTATAGSDPIRDPPDGSMRWYDYFIDDLGPEPHAALAAIVPAAVSWIRQTESVEGVLKAMEATKRYETILIEKYHRYRLRDPATILLRHLERRLGQFVIQERIFPVYAHHPAPCSGVPTFLSGGSSSYRMRIMAQASYKDFEEALAVALQDPKRPGSRTLVAEYLEHKREEKPEPPQVARTAWHKGKRQVDSTRIVQGLSGQLVAAVAGLDLVEPDEVDKEAMQEAVDSIQDSMRSLRTYLERWRKQL